MAQRARADTDVVRDDSPERDAASRAGRSIRLAPALTLLPGLAHRRQNDRVKSTAIGTTSTRPSSISRDSITFDKSVQ